MPQPYYILELRYTDGSSERHEIRDSKRILGRSKIKADLQVSDAKVSGAHAEMRFDGGELTVRDLNSTNGTHFHGTRMQGDFQLLPGESCKVGDATVALIAIEGVEQDGAKTMVGAPVWSEGEDSTRALDPAALAAIQRGDSEPAPAPVPAPARPAPAKPPPPASQANDWSAAYSSSEDNTPAGGAPLPPAPMRPKIASAQPAPERSAVVKAPAMEEDNTIAPPRRGLRWLLVALAFLVSLATMGFCALMSYAYVLNKEANGFVATADGEVAKLQRQVVDAETSGAVSPEGATNLNGWIDFYQKYRGAVVRVGWGLLGIGGLSFFLLIGGFLRGTGLSWVVGALGVVGGGALIGLTPQFDFSLVTAFLPADAKWLEHFVQPQTVAGMATAAFGLQLLLALGANVLGRRARQLEELI